MAPSTDLQKGEQRQVHECVAGDAGDDIAEQEPGDESRLAVNGEICNPAIARNCYG